jgi:hypothetical protein
MPMRRTNWDDFDDSDDEELAGGVHERAEYRVIGSNVAVLDAPDGGAGVLDLRESGETLACDARSGNWVRLRETFDVRGQREARGWAMVDGTPVGLGQLLQKVERPARGPVDKQPNIAPASAPVPRPIASSTAEATSSAPDSRKEYYQKWDSVAGQVVDEDEDETLASSKAGLSPCLKAMNPQAMHNLGYCWSEIMDGPVPKQSSKPPPPGNVADTVAALTKT